MCPLVESVVRRHARTGSGRYPSGTAHRCLACPVPATDRDLSPTARALRALEILQARPGVTAGQLAERLGVTERAARRYVGILREAGIPVESTRGPYGGYRLGRGTRLPPVVFTQDEALGLVMAVLDSGPGSDGDGDVGPALDKVVRALPDGVRAEAATLRAHAADHPRRGTRPGPTPAPPAPWSPRSPPVAACCSPTAGAGRAGRSRSTRGRSWCATGGGTCCATRTGRTRPAPTASTGSGPSSSAPRRFEPPDGLDPVAELEENLGTGWEFPTRVRFAAPRAAVAPWIRPPMGRSSPTATGCVLVGSTGNPAMYAQEWLAPVPFAFTVEEAPNCGRRWQWWPSGSRPRSGTGGPLTSRGLARQGDVQLAQRLGDLPDRAVALTSAAPGPPGAARARSRRRR